jgi:hypothetical protein
MSANRKYRAGIAIPVCGHTGITATVSSRQLVTIAVLAP